MNLHQYDTREHQAGTMDYAGQRELAGRLAFLNGFIGSPVSDPTQVWDRIEQSRRRGSRIRSKTISMAVRKAGRATARVFVALLEKKRQRYILRQSVAQLQALDERTLRDIGVVRGDIAALASGAVTEDDFNRKRSSANRPVVRLASSTADTKVTNQPAAGQCTSLVDHAA